MKNLSSHIQDSSRRGFFGAFGALLSAGLVEASTDFIDSANPRYAMAIDLSKCVGCQSCTASCAMENSVENGYFRTIVAEYELSALSEHKSCNSLLPRLCNHCASPACIDVCPTGASHQRNNGIVKINTELCIGCASCVVACPYGARYLNLNSTKADKCTLCDHRLRAGLLPACVESCVGESRIVGDINDKNSEIRRFLKDKKSYVLASEAGTNPQVFYCGLEQIMQNIDDEVLANSGISKVINWHNKKDFE